ncbi:SDR family NAD(P)-dependent oxidoreductase [Mycobacteroides chelonae]|uniref:SDR family NAD(P)-dependent oxidoreductase n=1 Tax=Mycobacteroides chelonae TaxID=1774 RepID=UPI0013F4CC8E|nr:SDR family NAD(P)-dependent oxidoreductase [Mycobacteroides chelonae]QQG86626.1 SDR family NAD(P)-dependent oxidoreductase [Mycobacteroides chelonae]QQG91443.1 SDR family NAD(P)-dependent oxidoreductase [Mycobacteroides chelonae]
MATFENQLVVVTGAGSGIGRATAKRFAVQGAQVVVSDINGDAGQRTVEEIGALGGRGFSYAIDVGDSAAMENFAAEVYSDHGAPAVVVNNAGFTTAGPFLNHTVQDWDRIMAVNFWGVVLGSRLFGRQMIAAGRGGRILNVTSPAAVLPIPLSTAYCTSKAAAQMFTECLRLEFAGTAVGVTAVLPAFINTGFYPNAQVVESEKRSVARGRNISVLIAQRVARSPETVARHIVRIASRNPALAPTPFESRIACASGRLSPAAARMAARMMDIDSLVAFLDRMLPAAAMERFDDAVARAVTDA